MLVPSDMIMTAELTAKVLASNIPIDKSEQPYANRDPSELQDQLMHSKDECGARELMYLISKTVTGFVATSRLRITSHLPSSSSATSFSFPLVLAGGVLFSSSVVCAALLGPATSVKFATKALRGAPRLAGAFEALSTA